MSVPDPSSSTPPPNSPHWRAVLAWWFTLAWPRIRASAAQTRQRLMQWWHAGPWHKAALLALVPLLAVCACCSGSVVVAMTPYGQQVARQAAATETAQTASSQARKNATVHAPPTATKQATRVPVHRTPTPTGRASYPVCNAKVTNTPCVQFATVQDAVAGWSRVGAIASASIQAGVVSVREDISNVTPTPLGSATSLDAIQFQCFNIQQAVWWGLDSTINTDATWTYRKSTLTEVTISFTASQLGAAPFASCRLTSARVDAIERAGMWDDGDYRGAWSLYDSTTYK